MLPLILLIGGFHYQVKYDCHKMGVVAFPYDDTYSPRRITVCRDVGSKQRKIVAEHELLHICYHNHEHHFKNNAELILHIDHQYSEEDSVDIVSQCLVDNRAVVYKVFEVTP